MHQILCYSFYLYPKNSSCYKNTVINHYLPALKYITQLVLYTDFVFVGMTQEKVVLVMLSCIVITNATKLLHF